MCATVGMLVRPAWAAVAAANSPHRAPYRWIVRAPIWIYRAGPGFVFGWRLLMLESDSASKLAARLVSAWR